MAKYTDEWLCQQIVDNTEDAIIFGDAEGTVRLWNVGAERIFGFRAEEIVGKSMDLIIPENLRERHWEGYDQTMKTGGPSIAEACWQFRRCARTGRASPWSSRSF